MLFHASLYKAPVWLCKAHKPILDGAPGRVWQVKSNQLFIMPKLLVVVPNAWGTASYVPQLWQRGPQGVLKRGVLKISKFWVRYRNICRMTQGIQWCNPFVEIFDNNQVTAILRHFFCKNFDFWSRVIHPPVDMKKLAHHYSRIFSIKIQITLSEIAFSLA